MANRQERSVFNPRRQSREKVQQQRTESVLSSSEVFKSLQHFHGADLIRTESVQNVLAYSADWTPFIRPVIAEKDLSQLGQPLAPLDAPLERIPGTENFRLPYHNLIPSTKEGSSNQWGELQFYWDTYFTNKALLASGNPAYIQLAIGQIENFQYMFDKFGYIPNGSGLKIINRTQTPFLTGMIMDIYQVTGDKKWLSEKMELAKREYNEVWMLSDEDAAIKGVARPSHRISPDSVLLRHTGNDALELHYDGAASSTLDDSTEWAGRSYENVALNLNCAVYKYEREFADAARILGNFEEAKQWERAAQRRKAEINEKMWDEKRGMYFNLQLNRINGKWEQDTAYKGLTSFMPLWVNVASDHQAKQMMQHLHEFENPFGLFIATKDSRISERNDKIRSFVATVGSRRAQRMRNALYDVLKPKQWDYPNVWAPIEYFAIEGMLNYQYDDDAKRIIEKVLRANAAFFHAKGTLPEKMNGLTGFNGGNFQYGDQEGYGWTCALNLIAAGRLEDIENKRMLQLRHESRPSS